MASYNMGHFIEEAIGSALEQSHPIHEILVVDDGSTDDTAQRLGRIKDRRVRTLDAGHGGVSRARNLALEHVTGDVLCFLDADDRWAADKVKTEVALFESEPTVGALFFNFVRFDQNGFFPHDQFTFYPELATVRTRPAGTSGGRVITGDAFSALIDFENAPSWLPAVSFRTSLVAPLRFDVRLSLCEDLPYSFSAYRAADVAFIAEPLVHVRRHGKNATSNVQAIPGAMYEALRLLDDVSLTPSQRHALNARLSRSLIRLGRQAALEGRVREALDHYAAAAARGPRWGSLVKHLALTPIYLLRRDGGPPRA